MDLDMDSLAFELEHPLFEGDAAGCGEAAHLAVGADDTVAWNDKRKGIPGQRAADGPAGGRAARLFG